MKEWFIRLTLIGFGLVVALGAVEFGLSTFGPQIVTYPPKFTEPDKDLGWKGVPNAETIATLGRTSIPVKRNSHGFRDQERTYAKGNDTFRILVLGDSFIEAIQVPLEEMFPYILEEKLNSESGKRFEVLNLGIGGYGTDQEYLMLRSYGLKYQPDLVILAFFIGNDIRDNSVAFDDPRFPKPHFTLNNGKLEELPFQINDERGGIPFRGVKGRLKKLFPYTYYFLTGREYPPWLQNLMRKVGLIKSEPVLRDKSKQSQPPERKIPLHWYDVYAKEYPSEWQDAWEVTQALILKLKNELEMMKKGFLVVVIPMELEYRSRRWDETPYTNPQMRALKFNVRKPERILSKFFEAHNIEYLLLRQDFEQYTKETGKDLYLQDEQEIHWNDTGHRFVAELVYKQLYSGSPSRQGP